MSQAGPSKPKKGPQEVNNNASLTPLVADEFGHVVINATPTVETQNPSVRGSAVPKDQTTADSSTSPKEKEKKGRNLIVCIDGTANQFGLKNTHVVELYSRLVADENQLTYYNSGIATYVAESGIFTRAIQKLKHWVDMAIAISHAQITLKAYQWLSENYIPGDQIYLFGFSRGAYQVRIIAGMFDIVGLLRKGNNEQIPFAYQLYLAMMKVEKRHRGESTSASKKGLIHTRTLCKRFKETLSHDGVQVRFVGVWDTVSSIGATRGPSFPETTTGMLHVRAFRHALALNELRIKFLPEYANGALGPILDENGRVKGDVKEVWFIGSHSDIGGGNTENIDLDKFGPPLRWMLYEAMDHGVMVKTSKQGWSECAHNPSMNTVWRIFESFPFKRLAYDGKDSTSVTYWPHFSDGRRIQAGQSIHASAVKFLLGGSQQPTHARINHGGTWMPIEEYLKNSETTKLIHIEDDLHKAVLDGFIKTYSAGETASKTDIDRLMGLLENSVSRTALFDLLHTEEYANSLLDACLRADGSAEQDNTMNSTAIALLSTFEKLPERCEPRSALSLTHFLRSINPEACRHIMCVFGLRTLHGHEGPVLAVAYSPDGQYIASGSRDSSFRLWDAQTGSPVGEPYREHSDWVRSLAFSPDGALIASGSDDNTILIWNVETQQPVAENQPVEIEQPVAANQPVETQQPVAANQPAKTEQSVEANQPVATQQLVPTTHQLATTQQTVCSLVGTLGRHDGYVYSVAFSPDGEYVVSGSEDGTVRIWETETRSASGDPLRGHTKWVWSVAISPDGDQIASGSSDYTVRIWDFETREAVRVLQGHSNTASNVAFTPSGKRIVSGSWDNSIRVWDVESDKKVLDPLCGHKNSVYAIAISPNGKYIASGGRENTIQLWNAETGQPVGKPLRGHTDAVQTLQFSPDNQRLVSGSDDQTLMIWNVLVPADASGGPAAI